MSLDRTETYLASLPADQRAALEKVRKQIRAAAPQAEPHFGYGLPGFTLRGHPFIYFGAAKAHCAIYGNNEGPIAAKLAGFKHSKGAIQFTPDAPLPPALIKEIVQTRAAANEAKWGARSSPERAATKETTAPEKTAATKKIAASKKTAAPKKSAAPKTTAASKSRGGEGPAAVDELLAKLDHPQGALVAAIRADLRKAGPSLDERVKWNAPSTHLGKKDFSAFNLRAKGFVQLILLFPDGVLGEETGILEGDWADRRFVRFVDDADRKRKRAALTQIVRAWISRETERR